MRQLTLAIGAACVLSACLLVLAPKREAAPLKAFLAADATSPVLGVLEFAHKVLPEAVRAPYTAELLALGAQLDRPLTSAERTVQQAVAQDHAPAPAPAPAAWATARPFGMIPT